MSKTKTGLKTVLSVTVIALIQGALSFYRLSVILGAYGDEINGVVQIALQISAYLVLFQSGMSAAYQYKMYSPLSQGNFGRVASLFSGLKKSMVRVSGKMLLISLIVIPAYSALIINQGVGFIDTALILAVIGVRITAPFFYTLPERCLIDIKEKKYIIFTVEGIKDVASIATEILLILFTALPLPLILCVNFIYLALTKLVYLRLIKKIYGISVDLKSPPEYAPSGLTKAVYAHQITSIATSNSNNLVLSLVSTLKNVTILSAYSTLISYPALVICRTIEGMRASLALKITRGDNDSYQAFRELLGFSFFCVCVIVPVFLQMANPFVALWIGSQYCVDWLPLIMLALLLADSFIMPVIYAARDARGLYVESKNYTIVQAAVNVALSIALAIPFGITGVLSGTIAAAYLILQPMNFRLVYSKVFARKLTLYFDMTAAALICCASYFASGCLLSIIFAGTEGWIEFLLKTAVCSAVSVCLAAAALWFLNDGFKRLVKRLLKYKSLRVDAG